MQSWAKGPRRATIGRMEEGKRTRTVTLKIDDLAFGGEGVGRVDGQVHFVLGALPGETVVAQIQQGRKRWQRAKLLEVRETSPDRIPPRCSHTSLCGGCTYQELAYPAQLDAKARQVRENLARIAGLKIPEMDPPLAPPDLFGYRNKMEFSFSPRPWDPAGLPERPAPGPGLGLHVRGRFDAIFDLEECHLTAPDVTRLVRQVREEARHRGLAGYHGRDLTGILRHLVVRISRATGEWLVALVVKEEAPGLREIAEGCRERFPNIAGFFLWVYSGVATVARGDEEILLFGKDRIVERILDLEFELSASSFFQTNSAAAEGLVRTVRMMAPPVRNLLDLYCGVGTLGLGLARSCDRLIGIESAPSAVADAERNARRNGIGHASFETAPVEGWLPRARDVLPELVVVDPPRAGMHPKALAGLASLAPPAILYVSCNPSTLARDLADLTANGYQPEQMRILDMFPHTPHVETVVFLRRP
jgi:23S rRNA (uracil1939-C5)-methyltransferase